MSDPIGVLRELYGDGDPWKHWKWIQEHGEQVDALVRAAQSVTDHAGVEWSAIRNLRAALRPFTADTDGDTK